MKEENYRYNAFISYRHNDLDKYVAENLHRLIETYVMPKSVVEKYNITDNNIRRVFRDKEELPLASNLEDQIVVALKESKFLIVICSPRLKESIWCRREIEKFIELHGRSNILCVLVEGEPKDSFPDELLHYKVKTKNESGKEKEENILCEPLAMDVRGNNKKEINKKLKEELIRIIAPMYNLNYDDIKRRHEERKLKRRIKIFRIITIASILFALYSSLLFLKIYISSKQLKYDQAINLANSAEELLLKDNRKDAIEKAYQSVTEYNKNKMPVTSKGIYELTESLGVYYTSDYYYPISQLNTLGIVESIKTDKDKKYLLSYDNSRELVLWDLNNENRIKTLSDTRLSMNENKYTFIGNKAFAYLNNDNEVVILDLEGNEINKISNNLTINNINSSENGKYFEINTDNQIYIYETDKYSQIKLYELPKNKEIDSETYFDEKEENLIFTTSEKLNDGTTKLEIMTYSIDKGNIINNSIIIGDKVKKIALKGDNLIALIYKKIDLSSSMIIENYNYKNGTTYFKKEYEGGSPLDISINDLNTILVSSYSTSYLLDFNTGEKIATYSIGYKEVDSYSLENSNLYVLFTINGEVHMINSTVNELYYDYTDAVYEGVFNFNLSSYERFLYTTKGILAYVSNDNRIIIYGQFKNDDIKEIEYEEKKNNSLSYSEKNTIIEEYNFENKNLIYNIFYSDDKNLLFVTYTDDTLEIYNNQNKKMINKVEANRYINTYICKTENNEYLIKGFVNGYVLNKNFELIAYVPRLYDYNNGKFILKTDSKYYEVKKYTQEELIQKAGDIINN